MKTFIELLEMGLQLKKVAIFTFLIHYHYYFIQPLILELYSLTLILEIVI